MAAICHFAIKNFMTRILWAAASKHRCTRHAATSASATRRDSPCISTNKTEASRRGQESKLKTDQSDPTCTQRARKSNQNAQPNIISFDCARRTCVAAGVPESAALSSSSKDTFKKDDGIFEDSLTPKTSYRASCEKHPHTLGLSMFEDESDSESDESDDNGDNEWTFTPRIIVKKFL